VIDLQNANNIGGLDIKVQLSDPNIAALVPNSGLSPAGQDANNVVEADVDPSDPSGKTVRVVVVSPTELKSGPVATFDVQPVATLKPWDSEIVTLDSVAGVNATNQPLTSDQITKRVFGHGVLVATRRWVIDLGQTSQSAASIATANDVQTAYWGYDNGQLHARKLSDASAGFGSVSRVDLGIGPIIRRPIFKDNFVYVTSNTGGVARVSATNGSVAAPDGWKVTLPDGLIPSTAPAVDETSGSVYVGTQQGIVIKLNAATGAVTSRSATSLGGPISADPAVNASEVWVAAGNKVFSLNPADLTPKKDIPATGGAVNSPPFISPLIPGIDGAGAKVVAVGSADGKLYLYDTQTVQLIGTYDTHTATGEDASAQIIAASYIDWPSGDNPSTAYVVTSTGRVHAIQLVGFNPANMGQTLTGKVIADVSPLGQANTAFIAAGDPKYGYFSSANGIAGLKLPDNPGANAGAAVTIPTPFQAFAPAAAISQDTLVVTLASGAVVAVPLLPEDTVQ
jgi:WD40 repeat protein